MYLELVESVVQLPFLGKIMIRCLLGKSFGQSKWNLLTRVALEFTSRFNLCPT